LPFQASAYADGAVGTHPDDVVQILRQCIAVLRGQPGADNPHGFSPREALLLIAHLVGDIHQPLHVGVAYVDRDGHFVVPPTRKAVDGVNIFSSHADLYLIMGGQSLHHYWDSQAVSYAMESANVRSPAEYAGYLGSHSDPVVATAGDPSSWPASWASEVVAVSASAHEGLKAGARTDSRDRKSPPHAVWPVEAPQDYDRKAAAIARAQLWTAGVRLAGLLRAIWP
jgi:hypothetical protein